MELLIVGKDESVESVKRRVALAHLLNHQKMFLLFFSHDTKNLALMKGLGDHNVVSALLVTDQNRARSLRKHYGAILAPSRRDLVECKAVTHIFNPEDQSRPDFIHHRNSGLNQVLLKLCKAHRKEVVSTLSALGTRPTVILGRMLQNARWCGKYKVPYHLTTGARTLWEQRDADGLRALERELLGS